MQLVTVIRAFNSAEAQLGRARLEAYGFHAFVTHELSALSIEGCALTAGGILVQVPDTEAADARALLDSPNPETV